MKINFNEARVDVKKSKRAQKYTAKGAKNEYINVSKKST